MELLSFVFPRQSKHWVFPKLPKEMSYNVQCKNKKGSSTLGDNISERTLRRQLKLLGLNKRNRQYNMEVRNALISLRESSRGYRAMCHHLLMKSIHIARTIVENLMRGIDPEGVEGRKTHRLRRRILENNDQNDVLHCHGYVKLEPSGFPIHSCIDSWSRKINWLYTTRSNNLPQNFGIYYLEAVREIGGCPYKLVTDFGTENGLLAGMHCFFWKDIEICTIFKKPANLRLAVFFGRVIHVVNKLLQR